MEHNNRVIATTAAITVAVVSVAVGLTCYLSKKYNWSFCKNWCCGSSSRSSACSSKKCPAPATVSTSAPAHHEVFN